LISREKEGKAVVLVWISVEEKVVGVVRREEDGR
jgi:hypothetical protein